MPMLLDDLASQHERLEKARVELAGMLSEAQAAVARARDVLLHSSPEAAVARARDVLLHSSPEVPAPKQDVVPAPLRDVVAEPVKSRSPLRRTQSLDVRLAPVSEWRRELHTHTYSSEDCSTKLDDLSPKVPLAVRSGEHLDAREVLEETLRRPALRRGFTTGTFWESSPPDEQHVQPSVGVMAPKALVRRSTMSAMDPDASHARMARVSIGSAWCQDMHTVKRNAVFRLQTRLGVRSFSSEVTPQAVHKAVTCVGLVRYSLPEIERWLADVKSIGEDQRPVRDSQSIAKTFLSWARFSPNGPTSPSSLAASRLRRQRSDQGSEGLGFHMFVETLLDDEAVGLMQECFIHMALTIREVLFSGDANRLVSQLTHVRVDDVAAPMDKPEFLTYLEPVVGLMILLNGICIGIQTSDPDGKGWFWTNICFTFFFVLEICLRAWASGVRGFLFGQDHWWNLFDGFLILMSVVDVAMDSLSGTGMAPLTVMRVLRLTRLTRLVRILRLRYMKELGLMVRGLLGGLYTLFWAVVLLFFTLYVIAVLAVSSMGKDGVFEAPYEEQLFSSVPRAFLTAFRCFMGDCSTADGKPIVSLLAERYGFVFVMSYFAATVFVTFGLFNLIVAIYIEITLTAAKTEGEKTKVQRRRECVRVAQLTRQLLKRFVAAQRVNSAELSSDADSSEVKRVMTSAAFDDVAEANVPVSKEMFLFTIQDTGVQRLMDDLDIPPDRAALFDTLDADGSGGLELNELITGMLQVRGEPNRSDIIGTLLAVRVVQDMLREQSRQLAAVDEKLERMPGATLDEKLERVRRASG